MDIWFLLMELVMLMAGAFLLGTLAQRLGQSTILGYLLAGTIIGPVLFNAKVVNQSAELGVSLLLFSIGLEFSFKRLKQMGRMALGGGTLQIVATMGITAGPLLLYLSLPQALTLAAVIALSSTAVVMRILVDRSEIDSVRGRSCLSILLMQDIAIVPLVLMVNLFSPTTAETHIGFHILRILAAAVGLVLACYVLLYHLVPWVLSSKGLFANRELTVLLAIAVGLGSCWAAHALGISPALGAFLAGMVLGESPYAAQVRADISTLRIIMLTLFFTSVGMLAKPTWFLNHFHWVALAAGSVFLIKVLVMTAVGRLFGLNGRYALATGISLGQIGEFSFVLAAAARNGGLVSGEVFDLIVSTIILLLFAAPYMVSFALPAADRILSLLTIGKPSLETFKAGEQAQASPQVLVVGFGPAGQQVVEHLLKLGLRTIIVDLNPQSRKKAQKLRLYLDLGDAANEEILLHAGLAEACMAVVTIPDPTTSVRIMNTLRRLRPDMPIAARCRYNRHFDALQQAGADILVDEVSEVGHMLANEVVDFMQEASGTLLACRLSGSQPPNLPPTG